MKNTPRADPRRWRENSSASRDIAAGTRAASPLATKKRARAISSKLRAWPEAQVHRLQTKTPADMMRVRL